MADLESVRAFTASWRGPLHILINNAGIMMPPELQRGTGGHEQQFATNYLGHFALALGLHRALADGGAPGLALLQRTSLNGEPVPQGRWR